MPRGRFALALFAALALLPRPAAAGGPGVVFAAGGVGGVDPLAMWTRLVLPLAGVRHEVRDFVWTTGLGRLVRDVQDTENLNRQADRLAREVLDYKADHPDAPVYLIAHSGGNGIILAAAERLPPCTVERMVLLSPAVSPAYDLRPALRATRREIVSFHSPLDRFWLHWCTSTFGTMDRVFGPSAGACGFTEPDGLDAEGQALYRRLVQVGWKPEMLLALRGGLHVSTVMPGFLLRHVAPWLRE